jgi:hypothetical protein
VNEPPQTTGADTLQAPVPDPAGEARTANASPAGPDTWPVCAALIAVALSGDRKGWIIAPMPRTTPYTMGVRLVVGDAYRVSADGEPEQWRAWLWPQAGGDVHVTQSCEAVDAKTVAQLAEKIRKRAAKGPWWTWAEPSP